MTNLETSTRKSRISPEWERNTRAPGHLDFSPGLQQPALCWIVDQLKNDENWWLKLSNGNNNSAMKTGWDDAIPFAKTKIAAAPDRMICGADRPHTGWRKVDNRARLQSFEGTPL